MRAPLSFTLVDPLPEVMTLNCNGLGIPGDTEDPLPGRTEKKKGCSCWLADPFQVDHGPGEGLVLTLKMEV